MSAADLRQAASKLRGVAEASTPGPWFGTDTEPRRIRGNHGRNAVAEVPPSVADFANAAYIATMHPGVGALLADWLDAEAAIYEKLEEVALKVTPSGYSLTWGESTQAEAEALARLILEGATA